jgi:hypothetical protein
MFGEQNCENGLSTGRRLQVFKPFLTLQFIKNSLSPGFPPVCAMLTIVFAAALNDWRISAADAFATVALFQVWTTIFPALAELHCLIFCKR